ncbi:signal recognition particle protein [Candidatus Micrarchaeota archaeon]|nr:signal recognition particle protein [Candidatus Micrarchaeota archaeon]
MDLGEGIRKALAKITGAPLVDETTVKELVKELQRALISNDVNVRLVSDLCKRIEERSLKEKQLKGISLREHVVSVVYDELVKILGEKYEPSLKPHKIMMYGLYGLGKTTSVGKIARYYLNRSLKVGVIAGDVHRPAAFEQLKQLSEQVRCGFYGEKGKSAEEIAKDALENLKNYDVLIFDSAGRSAFDKDLAEELKKVNEAFKPDEKYLVVSADLGQVAGKQAEEFDKAVGITGVIITKMDGSGKGGGALSSVAASGSKVAFIGTGEKMDALEVFDSKKFVARLVGFPDLESLLEKVTEVSKEEELEKVIEGEEELNYETFLTQLKAMKKMGPLNKVLQMMGLYDLPQEMVGQSEEKLKKFEAAVLSMTPQERRNPVLMKNRVRQERVAKGAGLNLGEVRELAGNFEKMQKMMKSLRRNRGAMKHLGKLLGRFKGMPG